MAAIIPDVIFPLAEAEAGETEFLGRIGELEAGADPDVANIVRFLRSIPAEEMSKKHELAAFFRTEAGQKYSAAERKAAYDELLGVERNAQLRG